MDGGPVSTEANGGGAVPVGDLSYTEASRELDGIVEFFERQEVDVDQLVARLERATAIVDELDRRIRRTRTQVEELVPKLKAAAGGGPAGRDDADDTDEEEFDALSVAGDDLEAESEIYDDADAAPGGVARPRSGSADQSMF